MSLQITFRLNAGLDRDQEQAVIDTIRGLKGVFKTEAVFPDDSDEKYRLLHVATTLPEAGTEFVASEIRRIQGIEMAYAAPDRRTMTPE